MDGIKKEREDTEIITGHLFREAGAGGLLRFGIWVRGCDCRAFPLIKHAFHHFNMSLTNWGGPARCLRAVTLALFLVALPVVSEALPLSVSPSVAMPGQTVTVTGDGFQFRAILGVSPDE